MSILTLKQRRSDHDRPRYYYPPALRPQTVQLSLGQLIRHRQAAAYDVAVRSWALHDTMARKIVQEVDSIRLNFIRNLFQKIGFEGLDLENRSRLYLYYAMTEPTFFAPPDDEDAIHLADIRLEFLTARPVTDAKDKP